MISRFHALGPGEFSGEGLRIVDEHREVLWTDQKFLSTVVEGDEGNLPGGPAAGEASWWGVVFGGHGPDLIR